MIRTRWIAMGLLALLLTACGTSPPRVTPTVAPTLTPPPDETSIAEVPTRTPVIVLDTSTPTLQPSQTATDAPTVTQTPAPTDTPTQTRTPSRTPTGTPPPTATPSRTPRPTATDTPAPTNTPSLTPLPLSPSDTPTATLTPTLTRTPTLTPSLTVTPAPTNTPAPTATNTPLPVTIQAIVGTQTVVPPTFTAVPPASPTRTLTPEPLPITPTRITATPGGDEGILNTPIPSTPQPQPDAPTATGTPFTPTPLPLAQIPPTVPVNAPDFPQAPLRFSPNATGAFTFSVGAGGFTFNGRVIGGSVGLFEVNPADPTRYARTNQAGLISFVSLDSGTDEQTVTGNPFFDSFGAEGLTAETNKNYITDIAWSPDGEKLAFIIQPPLNPGVDRVNAGAWFWSQEYGRAFPLLRDCPTSPDQYPSCDLVTGRPAGQWRSQQVEWSPNSTRALISLDIINENRGGVVIRDTIPSENAANDLTQETFWRYDSATWINDDTLLVSGRRHSDGRVIVGTVDSFFRTVGNETILYDASANGMWMESAVQRSNGQIVALGKDCCPDGALRLYRIANGQATPLSDPIGEGYPQRIEWSRNRAQVVLEVGDRQYVVNADNGTIEQVITDQPVQVGAVPTSVPVGQREDDTNADVPIPSGVIEGSEYNAGQQLLYTGEISRNMRAAPNIGGALAGVVNPGEFVSVVAGPYDADGFIWWQVSNARNVQAWVAIGTPDGTRFFVVP